MVSTTKRFNEAAGIPRGRLDRNHVAQGGNRASMRPRVFPAEDLLELGHGELAGPASMRPRVFPAEDLRPR